MHSEDLRALTVAHLQPRHALWDVPPGHERAISDGNGPLPPEIDFYLAAGDSVVGFSLRRSQTLGTTVRPIWAPRDQAVTMMWQRHEGFCRSADRRYFGVDVALRSNVGNNIPISIAHRCRM